MERQTYDMPPRGATTAAVIPYIVLGMATLERVSVLVRYGNPAV